MKAPDKTQTAAPAQEFVAFEGNRRIARGPLPSVVLKLRQVFEARPHARVLVFDRVTSELVDFDLRGTPEQVLQRLGASGAASAEPAQPLQSEGTRPAGPGRPRLGVVAREVTLLPRHWDWLNQQTGGASVALRKLVEQARRANQSSDRMRQAREASYRFMSAMAGDLAGFEEAARALFAADEKRFTAQLAPWPADVRRHLEQLAGAAFRAETEREAQHG